ERQRHRAREVLDGTDLFEDLRQPGAGVRVTGRASLPSLVADQPVERLGLDGKEVGNLKMFGDPAERDATGRERARRETGLRRAGRCQDASFRGPVVRRPLRVQPDGRRSSKPAVGPSTQGYSRVMAKS